MENGDHLPISGQRPIYKCRWQRSAADAYGLNPNYLSEFIERGNTLWYEQW